MSSDDGYILRQNAAGEYVLQYYFASNDTYPDVNDPDALTFNNMNDAISRFNQLELQYPVEYGLTTQITPAEELLHNIFAHQSNESESMPLEVQKFVRKPFPVDVVEITEDNMAEVAAWCKGEVMTDENNTSYVAVKVHNPLNERQKRGFAGDRVLWAGKGYKVYTPKAFKQSFVQEGGHPKMPSEHAVAGTTRNVFDQNSSGMVDLGPNEVG